MFGDRSWQRFQASIGSLDGQDDIVVQGRQS